MFLTTTTGLYVSPSTFLLSAFSHRSSTPAYTLLKSTRYLEIALIEIGAKDANRSRGTEHWVEEDQWSRSELCRSLEPLRKIPVWVFVRIPWNKVYRAFPELDRFDDRRCRGFIEIACRKFWMSRLITATLGLAVCGAIFVAALLALTYGLDVLWFPGRADRLRSPYYLWLWAGGIACSGTLVALMGLLLRDRWIRWAVSSQIIAARCLHCEYSLLGLVPDHNTVLCPECGRVTDLLERGLTSEQLLA